MALAAGAAQIDITPQPGVELMGYGARVGTSTGVHDRLYARALYLDSGGSSPTRDAALLVCADLCLMAPERADAIRARIAQGSGLSPEQILVSCTHTHSGPDTGLAALVAGRSPPPHVGALEGGIAEAGRAAVAAARPARLGWGRTRAEIGRNRRVADGPLNPEVLVLRVDGADGSPLAVLFHHGCHGTVLGHDNLEISADWPGVAAAHVASASGATALFLLGAHADVDPRTRGLMDLAIPGQSLGLGFGAVRVLGLEIGEAVLEAHASIEPADAAVRTASTRVGLPILLGDRSEARARRELDARKRELAELLDVPLESFPRLSELYDFATERVGGLPLAEARRRIALARLYLRDKSAPFLFGGRRRIEVEVQVVRLGPAMLLGLPLEPTTNVGLDWSTRTRGRAPFSGVCGIANGWLRYLPHPDDLAHPRASEHYEVLMSSFAPGACERLLNAGEQLATRLT